MGDHFLRPFRVAIRSEGRMVNAYLARTGTMKDSFIVASVLRSVCEAHPEVFESFKQMASQIATGVIEEMMPGIKIDHVEIDAAPEHERAGEA
jgi:hypothetical protein